MAGHGRDRGHQSNHRREQRRDVAVGGHPDGDAPDPISAITAVPGRKDGQRPVQAVAADVDVFCTKPAAARMEESGVSIQQATVRSVRKIDRSGGGEDIRG